jgi:phosphatidate cytidylyltransferase
MNLLLRIASALVLLPLVLSAIHFGGLFFFSLVVIAVAVAIYEGLGLVLPNLQQRRLQALILGATLGGVAGLIADPSMPAAAALAMLLLGAVLSAAEVVVRPGAIEGAAKRWTGSVFVALYAGVPLLLMLALRQLGDGNIGARFIYLCMAATWGNDTLAYFTGRSFGKHPLHPIISPKKTWEGFYGGAIGSVAAALICRATFLPELALGEALVFGLVMAPLVPLGDLAESVLKRAAGAKDSGNLIPGHGGLLDRIDALLFALPWTYLLALYTLRP